MYESKKRTRYDVTGNHLGTKDGTWDQLRGDDNRGTSVRPPVGWCPGRLTGGTSLGDDDVPRPVYEGARVREYGTTVPPPCYQPFKGGQRCRATRLSRVPRVDRPHEWTKPEPVRANGSRV